MRFSLGVVESGAVVKDDKEGVVVGDEQIQESDVFVRANGGRWQEKVRLLSSNVRHSATRVLRLARLQVLYIIIIVIIVIVYLRIITKQQTAVTVVHRLVCSLRFSMLSSRGGRFRRPKCLSF